jgi:hypothetical protein
MVMPASYQFHLTHEALRLLDKRLIISHTAFTLSIISEEVGINSLYLWGLSFTTQVLFQLLLVLFMDLELHHDLFKIDWCIRVHRLWVHLWEHVFQFILWPVVPAKAVIFFWFLFFLLHFHPRRPKATTLHDILYIAWVEVSLLAKRLKCLRSQRESIVRCLWRHYGL